MLARLSILFVQGEAVRHPQELANRAAAQLLARGEQSFGSGANNPTPGLRKTRIGRVRISGVASTVESIYRAQEGLPSQPSPRGRFSKGGGRCLLNCEFLWGRGRLCGTRRS